MDHTYPTPRDLGIAIPPNVREDRFNTGFEHALRGGRLASDEHFRLSFRIGFRTAKLYLRELRKSLGIIEFPMRAKVRSTAVWR